MTRTTAAAPASTGLSARVFLSYSRRDTPSADALQAELEGLGLTVFVDRRDIPYGAEWRDWLRSEIESADAAVFLVSAAWLASQACRDELDIAMATGKRLLPVGRGVAADALPALLGERQLIVWRDSATAAQVAVATASAVHADFDWLLLHRRVLVAALEWQSAGEVDGRLLSSAAIRDVDHALTSPRPRDPPLIDLQHRLLGASREKLARTRRRRQWAAAIAIVVLATAAAVAWSEARRRAELDRLATARAMLSRAESLFEAARSPQAALRLALAARQSAPIPEIDTFLRRANSLVPELASVLSLAPALEGERMGSSSVRFAFDPSSDTVVAIITDSVKGDPLLVVAPRAGGAATLVDPGLAGARVADVASAAPRAVFIVGPAWPPGRSGRPQRLVVRDLNAAGGQQDIPVDGASLREAAIDATGRHVAFSSGTRLVLYDTVRKRATAAMESPAPAGWKPLAVHPGGQLVAAVPSGSLEPTSVLLLEPAHQRVVAKFELGEEPVALAFSPDGRRLAAATSGGDVRVFSAPDGAELHRLASTANVAVKHLQFSGDGEFLAVVGDHVEILHVTTGRRSSLLDAGGSESVGFDPDGETLWAMPLRNDAHAAMTLARWRLSSADEHRRLTWARESRRFDAFAMDAKALAPTLLVVTDALRRPDADPAAVAGTLSLSLDADKPRTGTRWPFPKDDIWTLDDLAFDAERGVWRGSHAGGMLTLGPLGWRGSTPPQWPKQPGKTSLSADAQLMLWQSSDPPSDGEPALFATFETNSGRRLSTREIPLRAGETFDHVATNGRVVAGVLTATKGTNDVTSTLVSLSASDLAHEVARVSVASADVLVDSLAFSGDGATLAIATYREVRLLDASTLATLARFESDASTLPGHLAVSQNGAFVALLDDAGTLTVVDRAGRAQARYTLQQDFILNVTMRFSADDEWLVVNLGDDRKVGALHALRWRTAALLPAACARLTPRDWGDPLRRYKTELGRDDGCMLRHDEATAASGARRWR